MKNLYLINKIYYVVAGNFGNAAITFYRTYRSIDILSIDRLGEEHQKTLIIETI